MDRRLALNSVVSFLLAFPVGASFAVQNEVSNDAIVAAGAGARLDEFVESIAKDRGFSGTVLVANAGRILLYKGYGLADREAGTPILPDTAFCIGSNTKAFTAAAILRLEQMGKLTVESPISKFFDSVPDDKQTITIHQLLSHSAGFHEYHDQPGEGGDFAEISRDQALMRIFSQELRCKPGEKSMYSNSGYTLLAAIIENASGMSYEVFLRKELFKPANMTRTGFFGDKLWTAQETARGYGEKTNGDNRPRDWPAVTWSLKGAGGIVSTVGDMFRWHIALGGNDVLTTESKSRLFKAQFPMGDDSVGEGYGWMVGKTPRGTMMLNTAGGSDFGFTAVLLEYPVEDGLIAVMSNAGEGKSDGVAKGLHRLVFGK